MAGLDDLLDTLAEYPSLADTACMTLPPEAYTNNELYELEMKRIFKREWLCVGREDRVAAPGDFFTIDVVGEPMLIVRGTDLKLRALSSVCRHRYMPVASGSGNRKTFTCPYHSWVYATDGRLVGAPLMEGSTIFDRKACSLPEFRLETWQGFIFVNLDDNAEPLAARLAEATELLANYRTGRLVTGLAYEDTWHGNWKLASENGMEFYHHQGLHRSTLEAAIPAAGTYVQPAPERGTFTHSRCPFAPDGLNDRATLGVIDTAGLTLTEEEASTVYALTVFPNLSLAMTPDSNNWLSFLPTGIESTHVIGGYLVLSEAAQIDPEAVRARNDLIFRVNQEDSLATIELTKAIKSAKAVRGPLSPLEGPCAQLYKYLARTLAADRIPARAVAAE